MKKISLNSSLFYLAYLPWIFSWMLSSSLLKDFLHPYAIINFWPYIGTALLIAKFVIKNKVNVFSIIFVPILCLVGYIVTVGNGNASFVLYSLLLILSSYDLDFDKLVKLTLFLQVFSLVLTVFSASFGIIDDIVTYSNIAGLNRIRHALGYTFSTFVPNYFLSIVLEFVYLKRLKLSYYELVLILIVNFVIFKFTSTRLTFIMICLVVLFIVINKFFDMSNIIFTLSPYVFIIFGLLSYIITSVYTTNNRILVLLNTILSQRLRFGKIGLETWGVSLFGTSVSWISDATNYNYVDSSYLNILICYGLIIFLFVIFGFTKASMQLTKSKDKAFCFILILWAVRASIDPQLFLIWFNPFILYIGKTMFRLEK